MREREIILDTPYTIGGLELTDILYPLIFTVIICSVLFFFLKLFALITGLFIFATGVVFVKNKKSGKGWGWTTRFLLSTVRKYTRRKVYVV